MPQVCLRCQVLEVPAQTGRPPRGEQWPRDLLPWADPYIAGLLEKLERRYGHNDFVDDDPPREPQFPFSGDEAWLPDDAFRPPRTARSEQRAIEPVYGGWPLLDD
jgi:hypothetical protein